MNSDFPRRQFLLSLAMLLIIILLAGGMGAFVLSDADLQGAFLLARVATSVHEKYGNSVNWDKIFTNAVTAMTDELDRYSFYIEASEFSFMREELSGAYGGIGITVVPHEDGLLIFSVRENGPADRNGLLSGDLIIKADSIDLSGLSPQRCTELLRGPEGTPVTVTVYRETTADTLSINLIRSRIDLLHVPFAGYTDDSVLYIRLLDFEFGATRDVEAILDSLLRPGHPARGLILDLRGNPGGLLTEAYQMADLFLEEGRFIVGTDARSRWQKEQFLSTGRDRTDGLPMAVMVDRSSASAAEIVAGALGQLDRAILVGDTTFGKGLVQGFTSFGDGSGLRLTISRYYLEGDVYLNEFDSTLNEIGRGLPPDFYLLDDDQSSFVRELEGSRLLRRFAELNQEEIISATEGFSLDDKWVRRFMQFARKRGFIFHSLFTRKAAVIVELARLQNYSAPVVSEADALLNRSRQEDLRMYDRYGDSIKRRLKQLAWERKYGSARAYSEAVLNDSPMIQKTSQLLLKDSDA